MKQKIVLSNEELNLLGMDGGKTYFIVASIQSGKAFYMHKISSTGPFCWTENLTGAHLFDNEPKLSYFEERLFLHRKVFLLTVGNVCVEAKDFNRPTIDEKKSKLSAEITRLQEELAALG